MKAAVGALDQPHGFGETRRRCLFHGVIALGFLFVGVRAS
jgi:hypothetical protein